MKRLIIDGSGLIARGAVLENDELLQVAAQSDEDLVQEGNLYLGRVSKIMPSMNAAFVDIGLGEHAYLHCRDVVGASPSAQSETGKKKTPKIQELLKNGAEILVQLHSTASQYKGAKVTMKLAFAGKYSVLMPTVPDRTLSKKIKDQAAGRQLLDQLAAVTPEGIGFILRTECEGVDAQLVVDEYENQLAQWLKLQKQVVIQKAPRLIRRGAGPLERLLLDHLNESVEGVYINQQGLFEELMGFCMEGTLAVYGQKLKRVDDPLIFQTYQLEPVFKALMDRMVPLNSGGYLVIDETEALTIIDVNSGQSTQGVNQRQLILQTNVEAAKEAARQIKLRNINGIILIDFIDMTLESDQKKVRQVFSDEAKRDFSGVHVTGFSELCLMEMTRKRMGKRLSEVISKQCQCCGQGKVFKENVWVDEWIREVIAKFKHHPAELMVYAFTPELFAQVKAKDLQIRRRLEGVTSDMSYEIQPLTEKPFKMLYMGRFKNR